MTTKGYIRAKSKTNFNLSPIYYAHTSLNHKFSENHKISSNTNLHKTYTNTKQKFFEELVPLVLPLLKKLIRLGHAGIVDHSVDLPIPDFFLKYEKGMDTSNKKEKKLYKCITANTSVIWQQAAHTTDQLTSPSC